MPGLGDGTQMEDRAGLPLRRFQSCRGKTSIITEIIHLHVTIATCPEKAEGSRVPSACIHSHKPLNQLLLLPSDFP